MDMQNAAYWVKKLMLEPHAMGGGYYKVNFRSPRQVLDPVSGEARQASTSTYCLLEENDFLAFRKLDSDEIWYFHAGSAIGLHMVDESGFYYPLELSRSITGNLSIAVTSGTWLAIDIISNRGFSLMSCAAAPVSASDGLREGNKTNLLELYPALSHLIRRLCR